VRTELAVQPQAATERCPWCGSTILRSKFIEIETRIAEQQRKKLNEDKARMEEELRAKMQKAEARLKEDAKKKLAALAAERDRKIEELEARELTSRKEAAAHAEARAKADADKKVVAAARELEKAAGKIRALEGAKEKHEKDLLQLRSALEMDRDTQVLKVEVQHNREREQLQQKINGLTRQLQRKTSHELGEGAEVDVYEALRSEFPRDEITRIKKGERGADIRHQILHQGSPCGSILIDSKNRQGWQNGHVTKLREDQMAGKTEYAILATSAFPSGKERTVRRRGHKSHCG
jgi:hypothetical protein